MGASEEGVKVALLAVAICKILCFLFFFFSFLVQIMSSVSMVGELRYFYVRILFLRGIGSFIKLHCTGIQRERSANKVKCRCILLLVFSSRLQNT